MRVRPSLIIIGLITIAATPNEPYRYPEPTDHAGWLSFCEGMEKEVARQATMADNRTLYQHSAGSQRALISEFVVREKAANITNPQATFDYWEAQGAGVAGNQFWDSAPALDHQSGTGNHMRNWIIANRSRQLQSCDALAVDASAYQDQADKIFKALRSIRSHKSPTPKADPGSSP